MYVYNLLKMYIDYVDSIQYIYMDYIALLARSILTFYLTIRYLKMVLITGFL